MLFFIHHVRNFFNIYVVSLYHICSLKLHICTSIICIYVANTTCMLFYVQHIRSFLEHICTHDLYDALFIYVVKITYTLPKLTWMLSITTYTQLHICWFHSIYVTSNYMRVLKNYIYAVYIKLHICSKNNICEIMR